MIDGTPEQISTLQRQRNRAIKEIQINAIDPSTGEMLRSTTNTTSITSTEPDYIKIYYRTVLAFQGINDIPVNFLMALSGYISWVSDTEPMILKTDKLTRTYMCKQLGIKDSMYTKYIKRCTASGLLIPKKGFRGVYEVNPFFIARGRWDDIRKLRATFDFIGGKWSKHIEDKEDIPLVEDIA